MESIQLPHSDTQPNTHLSLPITFPFTITVASPTTHLPITFTVTTTTISITPIPKHHHFGLSQYPSPTNSLGLLLPISNLTLPIIINIATDNIFVTVNVTNNNTVFFSPFVNNTTRIPVSQRPRAFQIFNLTGITDTASITLPLMLTINITVDTESAIVVNFIVMEENMIISSDRVLRIHDYIAILTMRSRLP
ncbi:hypothetical protein Lalb_Chr08g0233121 [Lupinus albus]|uniref:Uncharacterized protein n=1 Tax=Lupinus albus TaxID=3870 RepID=A0A6A4Q3P0_LUPAL|nr:hypothetical protein Lalb_Chr08g0233121 [Lupinus albus]